jgi:indole-3-glycerol phosphate synthase
LTLSFTETGTYLDRILARTIADLEARRTEVPIATLERRAEGRSVPISLGAALAGPELNVIAEFKRASPSKGRFPVEVEPSALAGEYLAGGAAAISVLTDEPFFQGSAEDLTAVADVAHGLIYRAPVLRKDFVVDEYQLVEALAIGADAVLLIVAALSQAKLVALLRRAENLGLSVLVEVHDAEEVTRAAGAGASLLGINNRDLRTFRVDLTVTERLAPLAPTGAMVVGESGIFTRMDATRMYEAGASAILVGESLILAQNRGQAIGELIGRGGSTR